MFAYCNNNPVNLTDPTGDIAGWAIAVIVVGVVVLAVTLSSCGTKESTQEQIDQAYAAADLATYKLAIDEDETIWTIIERAIK